MAVAIVRSDFQRGHLLLCGELREGKMGGGYIIDGYMMCSECI